ncbi:aminoglycoside phosphotransferase (APT) family kinase protein [Luteibacter sp. 1214]|uniref:class III lanthionine synthetase LanKC n=1 Tax=Luteibacter sp. 1214 TaxID=2817735 RepID=UPI0028559B3B|nr:class III lanthionine synthetase LanKC [Luteibacter sp. 1214]MDR6642330.1 aminoglycoside phosphotransferase (APT) family kinase protein [Luteibacter sp. 1214]
MPAERRTELLYYTAVDREFFETHGSRVIDERDFVEPVRRIVPASWRMHRSGVWMHCLPPDTPLPAQGWKIHVSSVTPTAPIVLSIVAATLSSLGVAFKFAADARMHAAMNGKRWPRGGSGKFITIYPADPKAFRYVMEELQAVLTGYEGPHILSDRRLPGSRILHYRFGGIRGEYEVSAGGQREYFLRNPSGEKEPDIRAAYVHLPPWVRDPFPQDTDAGDSSVLRLDGGRYEVRGALTFSSAGGIYLALNRDSGRHVVIKEARPHIGGTQSATTLLLKEYRLLGKLAPLGVTPSPVAYFTEWEHQYLVEEYIDGQTLRRWLAERYPWLKTRATQAHVASFLRELCDVFQRIADALEAIHATGVTLGDFSFHNIMIATDGRVRIIDLEAAVDRGLDRPSGLCTPGFASRSPQRDDHASACAEDRYAFGANLFAAMLPVNAMLPLDPHAAMRITHRLCEDMGYPALVATTIAALMDSEPTKRPSPVAAMKNLRGALTHLADDRLLVPHLRRTVAPVANAAGDLFRYIDTLSAGARPDRYVPADPQVFERHPWGVAYGAAGIVHARQRGGRPVPDSLMEYLLAGVHEGRHRGCDLMHGDAGIAWVLLDAGREDLALSLLGASTLDGPIRERYGLYDGIAGWGLARIAVWRRTQDDAMLAAAIAAGDALLAAGPCVHGKRGWHRGEAMQAVGLGYGAAGIALFLLHLFMATDESRFFDAAREGLAFDLDHYGFNADGDRTWRRAVEGGALVPYLRHGTAGVLAVVARFLAATGDSRYRDILLTCEADLMRSHAISPGLCDGLAGIGETLLDLAAVLPERAAHYLTQAHRVAGGIELFLVRRPEGLAVPGTELLRFTCDLATGNAGVAAFFDRLWNGGPASFMLDEHLTMAQHRCGAATA